jgi:hypothetical protein
MGIFILTPVSECENSQPQAATVMNPPMSYDVTFGTPAAQGITPPFTNLAAHIDELNGVGPAYVWNQNRGQWL